VSPNRLYADWARQVWSRLPAERRAEWERWAQTAPGGIDGTRFSAERAFAAASVLYGQDEAMFQRLMALWKLPLNLRVLPVVPHLSDAEIANFCAGRRPLRVSLPVYFGNELGGRRPLVLNGVDDGRRFAAWSARDLRQSFRTKRFEAVTRDADATADDLVAAFARYGPDVVVAAHPAHPANLRNMLVAFNSVLAAAPFPRPPSFRIELDRNDEPAPDTFFLGGLPIPSLSGNADEVTAALRPHVEKIRILLGDRDVLEAAFRHTLGSFSPGRPAALPAAAVPDIREVYRLLDEWLDTAEAALESGLEVTPSERRRVRDYERDIRRLIRRIQKTNAAARKARAAALKVIDAQLEGTPLNLGMDTIFQARPLNGLKGRLRDKTLQSA